MCLIILSMVKNISDLLYISLRVYVCSQMWVSECESCRCVCVGACVCVCVYDRKKRVSRVDRIMWVCMIVRTVCVCVCACVYDCKSGVCVCACVYDCKNSVCVCD